MLKLIKLFLLLCLVEKNVANSDVDKFMTPSHNNLVNEKDYNYKVVGHNDKHLKLNDSKVKHSDDEYNTNEVEDNVQHTKFEDDSKEISKEYAKEGTEHNDTKSVVECIGDPMYCNMTEEEYTAMLKDYIHPQTYEWVFIVTYAVVFIVGLVGNALVCLAVYRNHTMRTVTNYFLVNLAIADFMVILFCLPATVVWDVTETWFLGEAFCKTLLYFQSVSVSVSVLTLTFISVDRWYAICFPLKFKSTIGRAKTAILIIWSISLIFNCPELAVLTTVRTVPLRFGLDYLVQCMATWSEGSDLVWHIVKFLFIYTFPLVLMSVAYRQIIRVLWRSDSIPGQAETFKLTCAEQTQLRSRRKAAKMLVAVVVMFAVCYFPVHLLSVLRYTVDMEQSDALTFLALISHVMCYANSAVNPVIYNFMSDKFRREFRRVFCCSAHTSLENFNSSTLMSSSKSRKTNEYPSFDLKHQIRTRSYRGARNYNDYYA